MAHEERLSASLNGAWELTYTEPETYLGERVQMSFDPSGLLVYGSLEAGTWQVMLLTYQADGTVLRTNQPSASREESTNYVLGSNGHLELEFGGVLCTFERIDSISFTHARQ